MLKKSERELIKTALVEYRTQCFRNFKGNEKEKRMLGKLNKLIQTWESGPDEPKRKKKDKDGPSAPSSEPAGLEPSPDAGTP